MTEQDIAHHSEQIKTNLKSRLNRIEGQVRAINRMLEQHMKSCIMNKVNQGAQEEAMEELLVTFQKLIKD
ncbi:TPA: metal-sensing transcriptional repressor [Staphylococcus aureus]|nr:metal-sensing transcriptional repressor [Staphylococcus aureus]